MPALYALNVINCSTPWISFIAAKFTSYHSLKFTKDIISEQFCDTFTLIKIAAEL